MFNFKLNLLFKGQTIKSVALKEGTFTIGRDEANDLQIDSLAIAPRHASLYISGKDRVVWQITPEFPLTVNGVPSSEHRLRHGDCIGLGKHELYFYEAGPADETDAFEGTNEPVEDIPSPRMSLPPVEAHLQVLTGKNIGLVIPLRSEHTRLGTEPSESAVITRRKDEYFLSALFSGRDIRVNEFEVPEAGVRLSNGDILRSGEDDFQFFLGEVRPAESIT